MDAAERGVRVRIVCNDDVQPDLPSIVAPDTAKAVAKYFDDTPVAVRLFRTPLFVPIHAKLCIVDRAVAFSLGSPFVSDYYDAATHRIADPRHGGWSRYPWRHQQIRVPVHDVSARLEGPVVCAIEAQFDLHWDVLGGGGDPTPKAVSAPSTDPRESTVGKRFRITRTVRGNDVYPELVDGETSILDSYLSAFASAKRLIYIENQYFTSHTIAAALAAAIAAKPQLQVLLLLNWRVDLPIYTHWQTKALDALIDATPPEAQHRIGVFTRWSFEPVAERPTSGRSDVH